ncbi:molybdopterin-dependent oxidoreductase [Cytophagaceae bacterium ABcell3]|nr:molybdopterin-dependent oxidoreductase [Cytophagaceae bacterium ABcell3]
MPSDCNNSYKTVCSYCGVGCGIEVKKDSRGMLDLKGDPDYPVNKGMLCSKGMNLHYTVMDKSDRILYPEMRWNRNMQRKRVSWDVAMERAAAVFKSIIDRYGPDAVGFYVSGQCLTEEYYIVNKLTKGFIGTNNIDTNSRLCMSSAVAGYKMTLGEDAVPVSYEDIELADCFFIAGANPAWCHPILFRRLEAHKEKNPDVKIIVADPRETQTCAIADLHLQLNPGTDIVLFNAIARCLIEADKIDMDFILGHTDGFEALKAKAYEKTIDEAANICGLSVKEIHRAAELIGRSKGFITMWTMGLNQSSVGVNKNLALINLNLITGKIGKPGSGPFSLTGQPNAMGGREVGGLSNLLPAHRNLQNPQHRQEVADFWDVPSVPDKPGLTATEMFDNLLSGKMKAVWVICTNPVVSLPDARKVEMALRKASFVIVQDISSASATVPYADLVLPAAGFMEKEGTMTNSERRITYLPKIIDAPGEALPDSEILCRFAKKMGFEKAFDFKSASDVYAEHCALTKGTNIDISGLSYDILKEQRSVQWPFPEGNQVGTDRLFTDHKFYTENSKAKLHAVADENTSETVSESYPLVLTTGRIRDQWHTMTRTGKVGKLNQHIDRPYLEINPADAEQRGLRENECVEIFSKRGNVKVIAKLNHGIKKGTVFMPMHWGKVLDDDSGRANNLTNPLLDPVSKEPDFKYSAVEVRKIRHSPRKIVIAGAGAAAFGFIESYRKQNAADEIHVFSKEDNPFYNRVLLPEFISGKKMWDSLVKMPDHMFEEYNIYVHKGVGIDKVDPKLKCIKDGNGKLHSYDILILGTGSRPAVPKDVPKEMRGIFTMRRKEDADAFRNSLKPGSKVVVVGGGLLGLELADSLYELSIPVKVVQRSSRLMDRQLDKFASNLLNEELQERGIEIFYNDEVCSHIGNESIKGVRLRSGRRVDCDALVYAIGTIPNIGIAREAGLKCNRGVVVNDYMQTSDPSIFALGEIAEHRQMLYGITAAAEEQAGLLARYLSGDNFATYSGSLFMNILKVSDLNLCSLGVVEIPDGDPDYEEITYVDKASRYYKKCILYKDKLVGAIMYGDKSKFNDFREMIKNQIEVGAKRQELILGASDSKPVIGKLVCSCNNVGEGNIEEAIKQGCSTLQSVCSKTAAGTGCGSCKPEIINILQKLEVTA